MVGRPGRSSSKALAASATEPVRLSSWAFQNWTILLFGSFFRAASKCCERAGMLPRLSASWASSRSPAAASFQRAADLGDRGGDRLVVVLLEVEQGELDQGGRVVAPVGDGRPGACGPPSGRFERVGEELGPHQDRGRRCRGPRRGTRPGPGRPPRPCSSLASSAASSPTSSSLRGTGSRASSRSLRASSVLPCSSEVRTARCSAAGPPLPLRPQLLDPLQGLRRAGRAGRRSGPGGAATAGVGGLARRRRPCSNYSAAPLEVVRGRAGLVDLAAEQVEGPSSSRGCRPLGDLVEQAVDDRLGLLGIARLDDRPGRPDLVLGVEVALPHRVLEVLPAQGLLLREDQGDAVAGLGLGDVGELGRGDLEVAQGAGAELGLLGRRAGSAFSPACGRRGRRPTAPGRSPPGTGAPAPGTRLDEAIRALMCGRRLVEPGRVVLRSPGPSRRPRRAGPSPRSAFAGREAERRLQRLVDHLQAAIALLAEPEVVGIGQVDLQVGLLRLRRGPSGRSPPRSSSIASTRAS